MHPHRFVVNSLLSYPVRQASRWLPLLLLTSCLAPASFAQEASGNPAVISRSIAPELVEKVGAAVTLRFMIGNNEVSGPISGKGETNRMGFVITLRQCVPSPANEKALGGTLLDWFEITYDAKTNQFEGKQKEGVALAPMTIGELLISAVVSQASASDDDDNIGAACRILPNTSSQPLQSVNDDQLDIYTHSKVNELTGNQVSFIVDAPSDRVVRLRWSTSPERKAKSFVVERSRDNQRFETVLQLPVGGLPGKGQRQYQSTDLQPYPGTSYYRLRILAEDGSEQLYGLAAPLVLSSKYGLGSRLIGSGEQFALTLDEPATAELHLFTSEGKELPLNRSVGGETNVLLKATDNLERGAYLLTVYERGILRQHRFVVR